jgi:hypothetical protein
LHGHARGEGVALPANELLLELGVLRLELADARFQERDPALVEFDPACGNSRRALFAFSVTNQEKSIPTEDLGDTRNENDR